MSDTLEARNPFVEAQLALAGIEKFVWGEVIEVHSIGPYAIIEYHRNQPGNVDDEEWAGQEPHIGFHPFVEYQDEKNGLYDMHHGYDSLDAAIIACVVFRHEWRNHGINTALNESLTGYIQRILKIKEED